MHRTCVVWERRSWRNPVGVCWTADSREQGVQLTWLQMQMEMRRALWIPDSWFLISNFCVDLDLNDRCGEWRMKRHNSRERPILSAGLSLISASGANELRVASRTALCWSLISIDESLRRRLSVVESRLRSCSTHFNFHVETSTFSTPSTHFSF